MPRRSDISRIVAHRPGYALATDDAGGWWLLHAGGAAPLALDHRHQRMLLGPATQRRLGPAAVTALEAMVRRVWPR